MPEYTKTIIGDTLRIEWDGGSQELPFPSGAYMIGYHQRGDWFVVPLGDVMATDEFSEVIHGA